MSKTRRRTFFRHTPTCKAAEAAELDAAVAAWQAAGGEIRQVAPLAPSEEHDRWKALPEPTHLVTRLQAEAEAEADLVATAFDQWKRKLPW